MKLKELLLRLGNNTIQVLSGDAEEISVKGCKLLTARQVSFSPEILYFATTSDCPAIPENIAITVLFREEDAIPLEYRQAKTVNLLVPRVGVFGDTLFNQLQECLIEDSIFVSSSLRLMDSLFSDLGLQHIVDVAYEITGHHIYIVDNSYRYLAISHKETLKPSDSPVLAAENELGYIADAGVRQIKKARLDELVRKSERPFYYNNKVLGSGSLVDIIYLHNVEIGHVMMFEANQPFTDLDRLIVMRLASIVSLELQKNKVYAKNRGIMYSYFLADLLENGTSNYKSTAQRLQLLGFTLKEKLFVMVIDLMNGRIKNEPHLEGIAEQLHWLLVGSMYVIYQNRVVILISRSMAGITDYEYEQVEKYLQDNSLIAGMSNCFLSIHHIQRHYHQAIKSAQLGDKLVHLPAIYRYGDLSIMHMLSICETQEDLLDFCSPELITLLEYDQTNSTEFTHTLFHYLMSSQKSVKASEELHIHKNTLLYRIDKIKKIIDNDLQSAEIIARLYISYKILTYLKKL